MIGATIANTASSILFAADNGAHVISASWGYESDNPNFIPVIVSAIQYAVTQGRGGLGAVVVFAAGNTASHNQNVPGFVSFPSNVNIPGVFTVGASDRDDLQADYSPTSNPNAPNNQIIDIVAPSHRAYPPPAGIIGETLEVWTIDIPGNIGYNPWPNDPGLPIPPPVGEQLPNAGINFLSYTGRFGGTSAAAPQISGIAALVLTINPNLTHQQVFNIIMNAADEVGGYNYVNGRSDELGVGRANACRAVHEAYISTNPISGPDRICTTNTNFTLQNVPAGQTVTWAVSPIHLFPTTGRSGTGATSALRAMHSSSSGLATLTYTIDTGCGEFQVQKQIWVGVPGAQTSILPNYQPICTGEYTYFNAYYNMYNPNQPGNGEADITNYVWTPPSGASCFTAGNKNEVLACWFQTGAGFGMNQTVAVRAVNSCGQGAMSYANFSVSDCFYFSVGINPNPASNRVTIELTETPLDAEAKAVLGAENKGAREYQEYSFNTPPHRIRVFDMVGAERICVENVPEGNRHELDISHLTPGVYVVHLEHRNGTVVRQLRVD